MAFIITWPFFNLSTSLSLEEMDWGTISAISKAGQAQEYFSLGDTKTIYIDDSAYIVEIVDFDHYYHGQSSEYGRELAGITFLLQSPIKKLIYSSSIENNWEKHSISYYNTDVQTYLSNTLYPSLSADLRRNIAVVNIPCACYTATNSFYIETQMYNIFPLSVTEAYGAEYNMSYLNGWELPVEGEQFKGSYAYDDRAWTRTVSTHTVYMEDEISTSSELYKSLCPDFGINGGSSSNYIQFAFCV